MQDYPATAKFLTKEEKTEVARRLDEDRGSLDDKFDMKYCWDALKDWKIWVMCFITVGIFTPLYCISLFLPTIVKSLGYKDGTAQLMSAPPYIAACFCCILSGYLADKFKSRGVFIIGFNSLAVVGTIMLAASHNDHVKYAGTFFLASGIYTNVPAITAWNGNNIGGSTKRSVGMAMQVCIGNLGGVMSAYMYLPRDSPQYVHGHSGLIGLASAAVLLCILMTVYLRRENARRDAQFKNPNTYTDEERKKESTAGDNASFFRYTV
jgi:MFS family permease